MNQVENRTEQEHLGTPVPRRKLSVLGTTTALALLGNALTSVFQFVYVWLSGGEVLLPVLVFAIATLLVTGLVAARVRWAPMLAAFVALVTSTIMLLVPESSSALLHPALSPGHFGTLVVLLAFALVAVIAGVAATIQNYQNVERRTPRWLLPGLSGLTGLMVGMILVAVIVAANPVSTSATTTTNGMPTVHMAGNKFMTNVVLVPKGESLLLVDDDATEHIIANGSWAANGTPHTQVEPDSPAIGNLDIKRGSAQIGPFTTAGVYHLYCTIHRGMNLTVVVESGS